MTKEELAKAIREDYERKGVWAIKTTTLTMKLDFEMLGIILEALEEPKWIPVSERLPKKEMNCLVTDSLGKVHQVTFYHALDGRGSYFSGCYCVRAWMPLPKPYEPQESEE